MRFFVVLLHVAQVTLLKLITSHQKISTRLVVLSIVLLPAIAAALDAPQLRSTLESDGNGSFPLLLATSRDSVDGYNLYRNSAYLSTHRNQTLSLPVVAGDYCVVGFRDVAAESGQQEFSVCSNTVRIGGAEPANGNRDSATQPTLPDGLRAEIYSTSALELFWDRSTIQPDQPGFVSGYQVFRDNRFIGDTAGSSFFEQGLSANARHQYRVEAITSSGSSSLPAELELTVSPGRIPTAVVDNSVGETLPQSSNGAGVSGLRAEFYSPTVAELFWDRATPEVTAYRVTRDGVPLTVTEGTSFFEPALEVGRQFSYRVDSLDVNGRALGSSELSAMFGSTQPGNLDVTNAPASDSTSDASSVSLASAIPTVDLREGDRPEFVRLSLTRDTGVGSELRLSAVPLDDTNRSVTVVSVSPSLIPAGQRQIDVVLQLSVPIGVQPLSFHERRVRLTTDDGLIADVRYRVEPVQAADVYLLIGQSNMEGFSLDGDREAFTGGLDESVDRVRQLNVTSNNISLFPDDRSFEDPNTIAGSPRLIPAEDPLHELRFPFQSRKGGTRIGPGLSFAKSMLATTTQEIILVPAAWSATGFCSNGILDDIGWNIRDIGNQSFAGTELYRRALARLELALAESNGILRGILWHQGEADSNNGECANAYASNLDALIRAIRTNAAVDRRGSSARGPDVSIPFVVGTMSRGNDPRGDFSDFGREKQLVDTAHRTVAARVAFTGVVLTDDLVPPAFPCGNGSCIHFGATAYREMGLRYADVMRQLMQQ